MYAVNIGRVAFRTGDFVHETYVTVSRNESGLKAKTVITGDFKSMDKAFL